MGRIITLVVYWKYVMAFLHTGAIVYVIMGVMHTDVQYFLCNLLAVID